MNAIRLVLALGLGVIVLGNCAHAGMVVTGNNNNLGIIEQEWGSESWWGPDYWNINPLGSSAQCTDGSPLGPMCSVEHRYRITRNLPGVDPGVGGIESGEGISWYYRNEPSGDEIGERRSAPADFREPTESLCGVLGLGCAGLTYINPPTGVGCVVVAGALCLYLREQSPDHAAWLGIPPDEMANESAFAVRVLNAGDGDWLSMALDGVEFFRQPLMNFTVDQWAFVPIPTNSLSPYRPPLWSMSLESAGDSNAEVQVTFGSPRSHAISVSEPHVLPLLLSVSALLFVRRRFWSRSHVDKVG